MRPLLTAEEMRAAESFVVKRRHVPEILLMEHAAIAVADAVSRRFDGMLEKTRGLVVAGTGNNGGDAMAAARLLYHRGCTEISLVLVGPRKKLTACAAQQLEMLEALGIRAKAGYPDKVQWLLDGIFGIGLVREVQGAHLQAIRKINSLAGKSWIVAIDVPSGLDSDTGRPRPEAVNASETVTFGLEKRGLRTGLAADFVGTIRLAPIQIPHEFQGLKPEVFIFTQDDASLPERRPAGHKGNYGHVYVWAGKSSREGAAALAALAALKAGAGLVTLFGEEPALASLRFRLPVELMTSLGMPEAAKGTIVVMGPGMGTQESDWETLKAMLSTTHPLVLDADALTLLSTHKPIKRAAPTILTPHPKEASRLLGVEVSGIEQDRFAACRQIARKYGVTVVLKGKGTVIGSATGSLVVVDEGDTGLSKGGSGDVLSGIIASLLGQGFSPERAAALGAFLHGRASMWVSRGKGTERSTLASEIAEALPHVFKELECRKPASAQ